MDFRRIPVVTFGIFAIVPCLSLQADDVIPPLAAAAARTTASDPFFQSEREISALATADGELKSADVIEPAACFLDPGSCSQLDGVGCASQESCDGCECDSCYKVRLVPYGWLLSVHGNATVRGLQSPIDLSTRDVLEIVETDADMFFMGQLEVEGPELGLIVNGIYLRAGLDRGIDDFDFNSTMTFAIVDMAGTYNLMSDPTQFSVPYLSRFDLLAGLRYWLLDGAVTVTGPLGNTASDSGEKEWVDPIIGGRIVVPLCEGAEAQIRGDVGGFGWGTASEFTWNWEAMAQMRCSESIALRGGYRILDVNNHRNSGNRRFGLDAQFRGPVMELAFEF